jgi:hypothetical protein
MATIATAELLSVLQLITSVVTALPYCIVWEVWANVEDVGEAVDVYFGGQRVIERVDDEDITVPAIHYFNISDSRRQCICFNFILVNIEGREV